MRSHVFPLPVLVAIAALALCSACEMPQDPEGTLGRAAGGTLRVGLIHNPPWTVRTPREPEGIEVRLIRRFAQTIDARPQWV